MLPIPIMSTETLASCAETRRSGAEKTNAKNKTRFIMREIPSLSDRPTDAASATVTDVT